MIPTFLVLNVTLQFWGLSVRTHTANCILYWQTNSEWMLTYCIWTGQTGTERASLGSCYTPWIRLFQIHILAHNRTHAQQNFCVRVPAGGTDEGEGNELVPERVVLRYGLCANQGLEAGVVGQVTDLASVGSHLYRLPSARCTNLHCFFTRHMTNPEEEEIP